MPAQIATTKGNTMTVFQNALWDGINAKRGFGWDANPWVVALTFTVHHRNIDQIGEVPA